MKEKLKELIRKAAQSAFEKGELSSPDLPEIMVEEPKIEAHGDFSTNIAMAMASFQKMPPRKIAETLLRRFADPEKLISDVQIAGPGFINFFIDPAAWLPVVETIHREDERYGASDLGKGKKYQVEFVSANPTGPLHVGHGRGAAVGDSVARILSFTGFDVQREYYINDSGRQIRTLGRSVFLRYKGIDGGEVPFPEDCYQGDYIRDIAVALKAEKGDALLSMEEESAILLCAHYAADRILAGIREDLARFAVDFDNWYSEQGLYDSGKVGYTLDMLRQNGLAYEKDGALWFDTSRFGDEKDRVMVRGNGQTTYFASDIAYHHEKYERGFEKVIDVWGADHHGYIPRLTAAIEASGRKRDQFRVILVHLVNLLRGGLPVAMSTRSGEFVTLKEVLDEVGVDAARFIFLSRHYESPLDFDLELAKQKSNDNPVYYVQYVHARISSIAEKSRERAIDPDSRRAGALHRLSAPEEIQLMKVLSRFPEVVRSGAELLEPHRITFYLMGLAAAFHTYYNRHRVLSEDPALSGERLRLVRAVQKVIRNGLSLLGVSAPTRM